MGQGEVSPLLFRGEGSRWSGWRKWRGHLGDVRVQGVRRRRKNQKAGWAGPLDGLLRVRRREGKERGELGSAQI